MNRLIIPTILAACALLASCSTGSDSGGNLSAAESGGGLAPLSQRLNEQQGYVQDSTGQWIPRNNRRSQFENLTASGANRSNAYSTQQFNAGNFQTAEWTQGQSNAPSSYTGDTDGSAFHTTAAAQGQTHRESSTRARTPGPYETPAYGTSASREDGARRHDRPTDAQSANRRESYVQPEIIDWRQQRELGVDQTRSMLAR